MSSNPAVARALATAGTKLVTITPGPTNKDVPSVDQHPCRVSNQSNGQIVWQVKGNPTLPFRVIFTGPMGSPFVKHEFSEADPVSGPLIVSDSKTPYKYIVSVNGGPALDPDVIVDP